LVEPKVKNWLDPFNENAPSAALYVGLPTIVALASAPVTPAALFVQVDPLTVLGSAPSRFKTRPFEIGAPFARAPVESVVFGLEEILDEVSIARVEVEVFPL
jgi:hypothetical protein